MIERTANCACGQLAVTAAGEPTKVSACHCLSCQRRTGSAFSVAVFFLKENVVQAGASHIFTRLGDSGLPIDFHFCPTCGSSVFWYPAFRPHLIGIAHGCFADRTLKGPSQAVYQPFKLDWVEVRTEEG